MNIYFQGFISKHQNRTTHKIWQKLTAVNFQNFATNKNTKELNHFTSFYYQIYYGIYSPIKCVKLRTSLTIYTIFSMTKCVASILFREALPWHRWKHRDCSERRSQKLIDFRVHWFIRKLKGRFVTTNQGFFLILKTKAWLLKQKLDQFRNVLFFLMHTDFTFFNLYLKKSWKFWCLLLSKKTNCNCS